MNEWEITEDDIDHVLEAHDSSLMYLMDDVDFNMFDLELDDIVESILHYTEFEDQVSCMHSAIEDQLIEGSFIEGPKQFNCP
jgi:hypothetical protein